MSSRIPAHKILSIPPLLSIPLGILFLFLRGTHPPAANLTPLWMVCFFWYAILTSTYIILLRKRDFEKLPPIQLQAQGLCIGAFTLYFDAPVSLGWIGASLLIVGILLQGHSYATSRRGSLPAPQPSSEDSEPQEKPSVKVIRNVAENLTLPAFVTTLQGKILEKNQAFSEFLEKKEFHAESLTALQRNCMDEGGVLHGPDQTFWTLGITPFENAYLICLEPFLSPEKEHGSRREGSLPVDSNGLYVAAYAPVRIKEEVERCQRYRRICSILLIKIDIVSPQQHTLESQDHRGYDIFCTILHHTIRSCDIAIAVEPPEKILMILPETNREGTKTFTRRLQNQIRQEAYEGLGEAPPLLGPSEEIHMKFGYYLGSSNTKKSPQEVLNEVEELLNDGSGSTL